jgi:hypothetical protein
MSATRTATSGCGMTATPPSAACLRSFSRHLRPPCKPTFSGEQLLLTGHLCHTEPQLICVLCSYCPGPFSINCTRNPQPMHQPMTGSAPRMTSSAPDNWRSKLASARLCMAPRELRHYAPVNRTTLFLTSACHSIHDACTRSATGLWGHLIAQQHTPPALAYHAVTRCTRKFLCCALHDPHPDSCLLCPRTLSPCVLFCSGAPVSIFCYRILVFSSSRVAGLRPPCTLPRLPCTLPMHTCTQPLSEPISCC